MLKIFRKFCTRFLRSKTVNYAISMRTKCHVCYIDFPLTVKFLLFTEIYHNFRCTWSFSLFANAHFQNIETQKFFGNKGKSFLERFDTGIGKK